jgi:hypothetical protein
LRSEKNAAELAAVAVGGDFLEIAGHTLDLTLEVVADDGDQFLGGTGRPLGADRHDFSPDLQHGVGDAGLYSTAPREGAGFGAVIARHAVSSAATGRDRLRGSTMCASRTVVATLAPISASQTSGV